MRIWRILQPRNKARVYWQACYRLDAAALRFLGHPRVAEETLWNALIAAQRIIQQAMEAEHQPEDVSGYLRGETSNGSVPKKHAGRRG